MSRRGESARMKTVPVPLRPLPLESTIVAAASASFSLWYEYGVSAMTCAT
jgi:hypothetical protein